LLFIITLLAVAATNRPLLARATCRREISLMPLPSDAATFHV